MLLNVCLNCDYSILYNSSKLICKNKISSKYNLKVKHCSFCNWFSAGYPKIDIKCTNCECYNKKLALCSFKLRPSDIWQECEKYDYCSDFILLSSTISMFRYIGIKAK